MTFPADIVSFTPKVNGQIIVEDHVNALQQEVRIVEVVLGVGVTTPSAITLDPAVTYPGYDPNQIKTVKDRLDMVEKLAAHSHDGLVKTSGGSTIKHEGGTGTSLFFADFAADATSKSSPAIDVQGSAGVKIYNSGEITAGSLTTSGDKGVEVTGNGVLKVGSVLSVDKFGTLKQTLATSVEAIRITRDAKSLVMDSVAVKEPSGTSILQHRVRVEGDKSKLVIGTPSQTTILQGDLSLPENRSYYWPTVANDGVGERGWIRYTHGKDFLQYPKNDDNPWRRLCAAPDKNEDNDELVLGLPKDDMNVEFTAPASGSIKVTLTARVQANSSRVALTYRINKNTVDGPVAVHRDGSDDKRRRSNHGIEENGFRFWPDDPANTRARNVDYRTSTSVAIHKLDPGETYVLSLWAHTAQMDEDRYEVEKKFDEQVFNKYFTVMIDRIRVIIDPLYDKALLG